MSVARVRVLGLCRRPVHRSPFPAPSRLASSDSHAHHEDPNVYPPETFNTPFWRNTLLLSVLGYGIYHIVPLIDEDGDYITRYIDHYSTPRHVWTNSNNRHLELSANAAHGQLLVAAAQRPTMHRMRNPASFNMGSTHCVAVGSQIDLNDVVVKKDKSWTE